MKFIMINTTIDSNIKKQIISINISYQLSFILISIFTFSKTNKFRFFVNIFLY